MQLAEDWLAECQRIRSCRLEFNKITGGGGGRGGEWGEGVVKLAFNLKENWTELDNPS